MVGVSSIPWMLKMAWVESQNVMTAPRKFQSTRRVDSMSISDEGSGVVSVNLAQIGPYVTDLLKRWRDSIKTWKGSRV
ncbi:hypothetical protein CRG98_021652 [Punica granatum]|uniref:Uncharacterized protein n=1 Tax=Punica granatum TaxID=22663 RepID=A0A2I0JNQ9_PUNGR|nr:hypothetical protein CRG98_021652 [Punica granatum]